MRTTGLLLALLAWTGVASAQKETDRAIREGNDAYKKGDQAGAIRSYEKARTDQRGAFNLGNAYYRQDSAADAQRTFEAATSLAKDPDAQARAFHNLGNSWMKQQKWQEAVNAYKQSLRRRPDDEDTRYNLAYAQKKLQEEQQKKKDQKQDQNQDQKQQDQKDQQQQQDQQQDQKEQQAQNQQGKDQPKQQQQPGQISEQDAQRILDALQQQEKDTQEKAREKLRVRAKLPIEKDW